ncbi:phage tail protein [Clostridium novyi]|uniref:Tail fiber protein H n=1 Tax=Clostridium novyi B str. ATCC 27606 TaxID=1443123 RepID=A0AA40IRQ8_CLONO|nr:phage tail protein [Clostridium novyi]KEI08179.1 tail fiber protein H [Clostridium novyi B str. NCTC 9691]KEI11447.1 tail fiber protein H [Clostridium novyi B str. ATCC 27606]
MSEQFYTILTSIGKAKIANASALGKKLNLIKFQLGDGGGSYYNPTEEQIELKNKVWEGNINSISVDENNPNWIVIQAIIPSDIGGFMIREAAILDDEENLIAIGKYPETYKPVASNGSTKDLTINMILEISNLSNITLKVDPSVIIATQKDIKSLEKKLGDIKIPVTSVNSKTGAIELKAKDIKAEDGTNLEKFKEDINSQYEEKTKQIEDIKAKNKFQNITIHINTENGNDDNGGLREEEAIKTIERLNQILALYTHLKEITLHVYGNNPEFCLVLEDFKHTIVNLHKNKIRKIFLKDCVDVKIIGGNKSEVGWVECYRSYSRIEDIKIYDRGSGYLYEENGFATNSAFSIFDSTLYLKNITLTGKCDTIVDAFESTVFLLEGIKGNDVKHWFTNNHSNNNHFASLYFTNEYSNVIDVKYTISKFETIKNGGEYTE